jgi:hypothetical protein
MYYFAEFFWISPCLWPNSGFWCCLFLTLRISLMAISLNSLSNLPRLLVFGLCCLLSSWIRWLSQVLCFLCWNSSFPKEFLKLPTLLLISIIISLFATALVIYYWAHGRLMRWRTAADGLTLLLQKSTCSMRVMISSTVHLQIWSCQSWVGSCRFCVTLWKKI